MNFVVYIMPRSGQLVEGLPLYIRIWVLVLETYKRIVCEGDLKLLSVLTELILPTRNINNASKLW